MSFAYCLLQAVTIKVENKQHILLTYFLTINEKGVASLMWTKYSMLIGNFDVKEKT
jgi:hypothetical protein